VTAEAEKTATRSLKKAEDPSVMKTDDKGRRAGSTDTEEGSQAGKTGETLTSNIGDSIDLLVEYLVDNEVKGIHPLIMGEVEKRLIVKVLQRSRGNKLQAAKWLGMGRNTFHRKMQKLGEVLHLPETDPET
jgi:DNA-binding protein Fis